MYSLESLKCNNFLKFGFYQSFVAITVIMMFLVVYSVQSDNQSYINGKVIPNLYQYSGDYLEIFYRNHNMTDPFRITRNSNGTKLIFSPIYHESRITIVSLKDGIKTLIPSAKTSYLDDNEEFVAWIDDPQKGIRFRGGEQKDLDPFQKIGFDQGSVFFFVRTEKGCEIYKTIDPQKVIASSSFFPDSIFYNKGEIYLFSGEIRDPHSIQVGIICQIFLVNDQRLELHDEIHIPRPKASASMYYVEDVDPWSDNILLVDVIDYKADILYLFNLKNKELIKIGQAKGRAFFLKHDILGQWLNKNGEFSPNIMKNNAKD